MTTVRNSAKETAPKKTRAKGNPCWPGFEPVPGKKPGTKGSCKPKPGKHSAAAKRNTQKAAVASNLEKTSSSARN